MTFPRGMAHVLADGIAPAISRWAACEERRILEEGKPLGDGLLDFAVRLGIRAPEKIRVMETGWIPLPVPRWIFRLAGRMGFPVFAPGGMTLGRGIYLLPGHSGSLPHELVHVMQYERLGGIAPFMRRYIFECLAEGYAYAEIEREARERSC